MTTPQHKDTTLDNLLLKLEGSLIMTGNPELDSEARSELFKDAKQALLQWRDKAVVEARADELNALIRKLDTDGEFTFILSDDIEDRLKQLKETPNEY